MRISSLFITGLVFATIAAVAIVALAGSRTVAICIAGGCRGRGGDLLRFYEHEAVANREEVGIEGQAERSRGPIGDLFSSMTGSCGVR